MELARVKRIARLALWVGALVVAACTSIPNTGSDIAGERGYVIEFHLQSTGEQGLAALVAEKKSVASALGQRGLQVREYEALPYLHVTGATQLDLTELLGRASILAVHPVKLLYPHLAQSLALVGQPRAEATGATGVGYSVAVLDTGADSTHPDLGSCLPGPACRVIAALDTAPDDGAMDGDPNRHGTNVSSIVARIAPKARIVAIDVFSLAPDGEQAASDVDVLAGLDWVYRHRLDFNIAAVNMSLGSKKEFFESCPGTIYNGAFRLLTDAGVAVVVASGNEARKDALAVPACHPLTVSVGASTDEAFGAASESPCAEGQQARDSVPCFSNSARTLTLLAPGKAITAGGRTQVGTSQAAPHVAGSIAALRSAEPGRTSQQAVNILESTGRPVRDGANGLTKPRLDMAAATNKPPVAQRDRAAMLAGGGAYVDVLANDLDETPDRLKLEAQSDHADLVVRVVGQRLAVLARSSALGTKIVRYRVTDEFGQASTGEVEVKVVTARMSSVRTTAAQVASAAAVTAEGRHFLLWDQGLAAGTVRSIRSQEVSPSGVLLSTPRIIRQSQVLAEADRGLSADVFEGNFVVGWAEGSGSSRNIMAVNESAAILGTPYNASFAERQGTPAEPLVTALGHGAVISWRRDTPASTPQVAQGFTWGPSPAPEGNLQPIANVVSATQRSTIRLGADSYLYLRLGPDLSGRAFDLLGRPKWQGWRQFAGGPGILSFDAAPAGAGRIAVTFVRFSGLERGSELVFQEFDTEARPIAPAHVVHKWDWQYSGPIALLRLDGGSFRAVWRQELLPTLSVIASKQICRNSAADFEAQIDYWATNQEAIPTFVHQLALGSTEYLLSFGTRDGNLLRQVRETSEPSCP